MDRNVNRIKNIVHVAVRCNKGTIVQFFFLVYFLKQNSMLICGLLRIYCFFHFANLAVHQLQFILISKFNGLKL